MTQEDKDLLLKDLCARLTYRVKVRICDDFDSNIEILTEVDIEENRINGEIDTFYCIDNIKPYLRPMSSMTEEEKEDFPFPYYFEWIDSNFSLLCSNDEVCASIGFAEMYEIMDWLNARHFDYRGLIEKGLALEAPEGMYN